ncbi:MAG TPA: FecR domain-containing protein [Chryseolinea sp.]|nr:FecR domain-containing protein [Chryseolinea sp.]
MTDYEEQLILKLLDGTISPNEHRILSAWMEESEENKKLVSDFTVMWQASKDTLEEVDYKTGEEWTKFESFIDQKHVERSKEIKFYSFSNGLKIAASISAIALFSWILYLIVFSHETVLKESGNAMVQLDLPDGSRVWLNHYSRITYQDDFNSNARILILTGEAFFEVKPDPQKPFVIECNSARIKVLGTSFNVRAYEESATEVFVTAGLVNFSSIKNKEGINLKPGETAVTKNDIVLMLDGKENANVLAWKEKQLIFKSSSLRTVIKDLEAYFKIDIKIRNEEISHCRFTGSFNQPTIEEIIEALSVSLDLTIAKDNNVYIVDGDGC